MAHIARCEHCKIWHQTWTTCPAATYAAVWHVYNEHPDVWKRVIGDRPPDDPPPETRGELVESYLMANANRCAFGPQHVMVNQGRRESLQADLFVCTCGERDIGNTDEGKATMAALRAKEN